MRRSEWSVWLVTYQGAFVIVRRSFDWYHCITDIFDLLAQPQSAMPYVHMGFSTVLYISSLFSSERGEFFPISQFISLVLRSSCFLFLVMCSFPVNLLSRCSPRYFTVEPWGMVVWLMLIGGHCPLRLVNVICVDLFWLTFIRHFCSHFSMLVRWSCRFLDAVVGSESFAIIAVSSAKVLITVFFAMEVSNIL